MQLESEMRLAAISALFSIRPGLLVSIRGIHIIKHAPVVEGD